MGREDNALRFHKCSAPTSKSTSRTQRCMQQCGLIMFRNLLRVEFLLKTDSGYPKDTGVNKPWQPLGIPFAITPIGQLHLFAGKLGF